MVSRAKSKPQPDQPPYTPWRGKLIAKLALVQAGLTVQDAAAPPPFDLLASTPDGFYLLAKVDAYSSMHGREPTPNGSPDGYQWPVDASLLRAAADVNLPVVLFVVDADREVGHYARLDRLPRSKNEPRTTHVPLAPNRNLAPQAISALVAELRDDWAVSRRPA